MHTASLQIKGNQYNVIALSITSVVESRFSKFHDQVSTANPSTQWILVAPPEYDANQILNLHRKYRFFQVLDSFSDKNLHHRLTIALSQSMQIQQDTNLQALTLEQNSKLETLQIELENRIEKRTLSLSESRQKLFLANQRLTDLQKCIIASQKARSVDELEKAIQETLARSFQMDWIKIHSYVTDPPLLKESQTIGQFTVHRGFIYDQNSPIGEILFFRGHTNSFSRDEKEFLNRITDVISPIVQRLNKTKESEFAKKQWEATFNSILNPIILVDNKYNVIQTNGKGLKNNPDQLKCYQYLFEKNEPCRTCRLGQNFRLQPSIDKAQTLDVSSHRLRFFEELSTSYVNVYRDVTEKLELEKRILENARLAELGIIGSSIAHELNNPLAGMLSYSQLMLMDLSPEHPIYAETKEIEAAIKKCRDIVQDLLGFARLSDDTTPISFSPLELCVRAKNILDIRARAFGVPIDIESKLPPDFQINGQKNLMLQAINHVLHSCWESICPLDSHQPRPGSWIQIELSISNNTNQWVLIFKDNGKESLARSIGLAIPMAHQIFRDHGGSLEMSQNSQFENIAKVTFNRPVLAK